MIGGLWLALSQGLLGWGLPTFHVIFRESNTYIHTKCVKFEGQIVVRMMPPFLFFILEIKVIKRCSSSIHLVVVVVVVVVVVIVVVAVVVIVAPKV